MQERSSAKPLPTPLLGQGAGKELAGRAPRKPFLLLIGAITIPLIVLDQATKMIVKPLPSPLLGQGAGKELAGRAPRKPFLLLIGAITIPLIVLDQATKLFVKAHMALYESIALVPNYLDITYTLNPGAAFSILADAPPWARRAFLLSMSCAAIIVLVVLIARSERVSINSVGFALILAGATGNLIDRATRGGRVIDFVRAHYYDLNYPVFNVADSAITIGVALIILAALFGGDAEPKSNRSS